MLVTKGSVGDARALKWLLKNFELVSGLSVNFEKSNVFGINMEDNSLQAAARELGCAVGRLPIPYLGLKVGGQLAGVWGWVDVVDKVRGRLRRWDTVSLSFGEHCTIVKSVLSAIPLYYMSFIPIPKQVVNQIKSLQCRFLWE